MSTTFHIYMPISALEDKLDKIKDNKAKDQECMDMFGIGYLETIASIANMKLRGLTVIPSQGCDNQSSEGKCLGHTHE